MRVGGKLLTVTLLIVFVSIQIEAQSCDPACQNGGLCSFQLTTGTSSCNCAGTGYTGATCSTPAGAPSTPSSATNTTSPSTATNTTTPAPAPSVTSTTTSCPVSCYNGQCLQENDSQIYYCQCNSGFSGTSCNVSTSTPAPAPITSTTSQLCPVTCYNGACEQENDSQLYFCQCYTGYTGTSCNQTSTTTASTAPTPSTSATVGCSAGCSNGQCLVFSNGTSQCQCNSGYTGSTCSQRSAANGSTENSNSSSGGGWSGGAIFGVVLIVMVAAIALSAAAFLLWRRRRRQTFVRFQDGQEFNGSQVEIGRQKLSSDSLGMRSSGF